MPRTPTSAPAARRPLRSLSSAKDIKTTSRIPGIHTLTRTERLARVAKASGLSAAQQDHLAAAAAHDGDLADNLSENVISVMSAPLGVATGLIVDGMGVLVVMATEESSVIAAICNGARA